jgi:hypothetical protein
MTPEEVITAIKEGWPNAAANSDFWRVQYIKQLDRHSGPDLAAGWQRVLEDNPSGTPPKPDQIAKKCRELKQGKPQAYQSRKPEPPPPSKQLTPQGLADTKLRMAETQAEIDNGTAGPMAETLMRVWQGAIDSKQ